jgi:D-inositol-3-phosphate glycosyltransferase
VIPHEGRPGDAALTRYALAPVKGFIAQSKSVHEDLLKFRPDAHCLDVPHPVYSIFPEGRSREEAKKSLGVTAERVALFFGFIRRYKGLLTLFQALSLIPKRHDIQLLVGGEFYEDDSPYRRMIKDLDIADRVVLHDRYIPNEEVGDFFNAANLAVLPYISATQSGIIQIAFNYDKPVITTNVGGLPEVVRAGELGEVVPAEDPKALAAAIVEFFEKGNEAPYSAAVAKEKEKYSWQALVDGLEALAANE